jgi:Bacterial Ig-like domain
LRLCSAAPSGTTNDNTPTISFHAADDNLSGVTFSCRVDGGPTAACTSPVTFGPLPDGPHTISVAAADQAGNESPPKSASFTISTLQPVAPVTPTSPVPPAVKKKCKKKLTAAAAKKKKCKKKKR